MAGSVLIVGAGISGLSAAEWLRRDGWQVTLIDPVRPGDSEQASFGNAGLIARTSVLPVATPALVRKAPLMALDPASPLFLRWSYLPRLLPWLVPFLRNAGTGKIREIATTLSSLTFDATEQHVALSKGTGADAHIASGDYVTLYATRADYEGDTLTNEIRRQFGIVPTALTRQQLEERDPHLGPAYQFGTLFTDFCWLTSPSKYVAALFDHLCREGAAYRQARVVDMVAGERPSVTLEGGETLVADKVVLTAGAWSGRLARAMGVPTKLEAERGYHVSMYAPSFTAPQPYMVTDAKCVVTPMDGFLRAAGVVEFAGIDAPPSPAPVKLIEAAMRKLYPGLSFERSESWMGRRPTTPDSLPAIGEAASAPNVIHAYGGQHVGMTIGPKLGRLVADLARRRPVNLDLTACRPDRF
ncbi:MAG: FAD-binding oxidoreductase [Rhodobiaceae bacterium]|nr:FAD-binding oxidoreductase [Rhodobiaceae bacterium]MCC0018138.1 FAD-binding oxidoreductase [Rhodobiaceae bacterium]MCC0042590.1 FAD-binding oxidoreductase [Rhodobiaceae bacterium]MCC0051296.1 FAD-binding oxidoreductase [Rhodobiaceae bacterium]